MAETVAAITNGFLMPGEAILSFIGWLSPETEAIMRIDYGGTIYPVILSLVAWTVVLVIGLFIFKIIKNAIWQTNALIHTAIYAVRNLIGNIKTRLLWKWRQFFPHKADSDQIVSQEEFDKLDVAVLRTFFKNGPEKMSSAKELAKQFKLRPAQIQHRLDNLSRNQMVESAKGSGVRRGSYQLTESGLAFITMMQRQARITPTIGSASASGSG